MRVLVVEDEHRIAAAIKRGLVEERYAVDIAHDGETGLNLALGEDYDAIVLDRLLPKLDGVELARQLRREGNHTPILFLTAKSQLEDKVEGLDAGADDYLTKPFAFEELLARLRALTRRPHETLSPALTHGGLVLNPQGFIATRAGRSLNLSRKEFALLEYLLRHAGQVLTKDQLITHVWDYDADVLPNTVEVNIRNLRKKLGRPELIHTLRGFGYKLSAPSR